MLVGGTGELRDPGKSPQEPLLEGRGLVRLSISEGLDSPGQVVELQMWAQGRNKARTRFHEAPHVDKAEVQLSELGT